MKIIITESKMMNVLETFLNKNFSDYDEICQFIIDPDYEGDEPIWVYMVISKDWYYYGNPNESNKTHIINQLKREVRVSVKLFMNIDIFVGVYVREC
jgi:hypothetical protein